MNKIIVGLITGLAIFFVIDKAKNFINAAPGAYTAFNIIPSEVRNHDKPLPSKKSSPRSSYKEEFDTKSAPSKSMLPHDERDYVIYLKSSEPTAEDVGCQNRSSPFRARYNSDCWYDKSEAKYNVFLDGFQITGHFDVKTGKITDRHITYMTKYDSDLEKECTVRPEWGDQYVNKDCITKLIEEQKKEFDRCIYKRRLEGRNVYRVCKNHCGGGIGHCD